MISSLKITCRENLHLVVESAKLDLSLFSASWTVHFTFSVLLIPPL